MLLSVTLWDNKMITLQQWMELVDCKITEGSEWYSNVPNLYSLTSWNERQDGYSLTIVFAPKDSQRVYLVEVSDYKNNRAYRLIDPEIKSDAKAYDEVDFVDLESDEDFLEKARAIIAGEEYDTRVSIPVDMPDEELLRCMMAAHKMDITFNQFIELALREVLKKEGLSSV